MLSGRWWKEETVSFFKKKNSRNFTVKGRKTGRTEVAEYFKM